METENANRYIGERCVFHWVFGNKKIKPSDNWSLKH